MRTSKISLLIVFALVLLAAILFGVGAEADSTIGNLPNGGLIQTTDQIGVARCTGVSGCNYRVTVGPLAPLSPGSNLAIVSGNLNVVTGTGGSSIPALNGNLNFSGNDAFNGTSTFNGAVTVNSNPFKIDLNAAPLPAAQTGTVLQVANANATPTRIEADAFGTQAFFTGACYGGTNASPTAITSGTQCGGYNEFLYNGSSVVGPLASFRTFAAENQSSGHGGSYAEIATTPVASTTMATAVRFENDGGVTVPPTVTGGDKGPGNINAAGLWVNGGAIPLTMGGTASTTGLGALQTLVNDNSTSGGDVVLGTHSVLADFPNFWTAGTVTLHGITFTGASAQQAMYQQSIINAWQQAVALGVMSFGSLHMSACIQMVDTGAPFGINLAAPLWYPRGVCPDHKQTFIRDGSQTYTVTGNWDGEPTHYELNNPYEPEFIGAPGARLEGTTITNLNRIGTDRGSGPFYGRFYSMAHADLRAGGSGIPGSSISCTVNNGDPVSPSSGATVTFTVSGGVATGVSAFGGSAGRWSSGGGHYSPPPFLERWAWPPSGSANAANNWDGHDFYHPQVFDNTTNWYYKTNCGGTDYGITVFVTFWPDWCTGSAPDSFTISCAADPTYYGTFSNYTPTTGHIGRVYATQSTAASSASYGKTYAYMQDSFDTDVDYLQTAQAYYGYYNLGADTRVTWHNDVGSTVGLKVASGGSFEETASVLDSETDHAAEFDGISNFSDSGTIINTAGTEASTLAVLQFGQDSSFSGAGNLVTNGYIRYNMENAGNNSAAVACANTQSTWWMIGASNIKPNGTAQPGQVTSIVNEGTNCNSSNLIMGLIDNVAGSLFPGTDSGMGVFVWDSKVPLGTSTFTGGFALPHRTYIIFGSGAPNNGSSNSTGLNKAGPGSIYLDYTNGAFYINTGTAASPLWGQPGGTAKQRLTFVIPGTLTVANDQSNWLIMTNSGTITKAWAIAKTGPTGQALIFDIQKSTNNGGAFTSIWNVTPANKIQIAASAVAGTQTSFDTTTYNAGDVFRIDVDQIGSGTAGANATVELAVTQ